MLNQYSTHAQLTLSVIAPSSSRQSTNGIDARGYYHHYSYSHPPTPFFRSNAGQERSRTRVICVYVEMSTAEKRGSVFRLFLSMNLFWENPVLFSRCLQRFHDPEMLQISPWPCLDSARDLTRKCYFYLNILIA